MTRLMMEWMINMGIDHSLGCDTCRAFMSLHKWPILEGMYAPSHLHKASQESLGDATVTLVTAEVLLEALEESHDQLWTRELQLHVIAFVKIHHGHRMFLVDDIGDLPWEIGMQEWMTWRADPAGVSALSDTLLLPRNLVFDHKCRDWDAVLALLQCELPWMLEIQLRPDLEELRRAFIATRTAMDES